MASRITDADIDACFNVFDNDGFGRIHQEELHFALKGLGFPEISKADVVQIMRQQDKNGSGTIDKEGFRALIRGKMKKADSSEESRAAFNLFDRNKTGKISFSDLCDIAKVADMTDVSNEDFLREVMKAVDRDQDGEIGWEDWSYVMAWLGRKHGEHSVNINRWTHFGLSQTQAASSLVSFPDEKVTHEAPMPKSIALGE